MKQELPQVGGADLCVLTTPDMAPIWSVAVRSAGLQGRFRVVEVPPSMSEIPTLLDGVRLVLLDSPLWAAITHFVDIEHLVLLSRDWSIETAVSRLDEAGYSIYRGQLFQAELFGAHSIVHRQLHFATAGVEIDLPVLAPTHGPGAGLEDELVLWNSEDFVGRGVRVSRDDPAVIEETFRATMGQAPLWVQPEFPFLVPRAPSTFTSLDGESVQGLLCSSHERAGGWVVLTRRDVLDLLGHPGEVPWSRIPDLIGVQAAAALLSWLASSTAPTSGM